MFRMTTLDPPTLSRALRERCPNRSEDDYQAAESVSGGWLGPALEALEASRLSERTERFAAAFGSRDALAMTELLAGMEKLSRDDFCAELTGWMRLIHQALRASAGLSAPAHARQIAAQHTGAALLSAMDALRKAWDYAQSNVGVGHLCGALRTLIQ